MNLPKIFQAIEETQFLKKLSFQERLLFVGGNGILSYIKDFNSNDLQSDRNYYYDLSVSNLKDIADLEQDLSKYRAVIVASAQQEDLLYPKVQQKINSLGLDVPVVRLFADVFTNVLCQKQLLKATSDEIHRPKLSYAILTTPRSGSTYFCELLDSTGIAGHPMEHLRLATQALACNCNFNYLRLLHNLMQHRTTENGVFGTKIISHFLFELKQTKPNFKQFLNSIDKYILLVRRDKLAQAVSLVIAQETEIWHIHKNVNNKNVGYQSYQSKLENITIDDALLKNVEQKYQFINNQEARLRKIFAANNIEPLELIYEDIVEDAESQINYMLDFLEIVKPPSEQMNISSQIKKMPSSISQEIMRQYEKRKSTAC